MNNYLKIAVLYTILRPPHTHLVKKINKIDQQNIYTCKKYYRRDTYKNVYRKYQDYGPHKMIKQKSHISYNFYPDKSWKGYK